MLNYNEKDKVKRKNFFIVSNRIFDFELNPYELAIYFCLMRYSNIYLRTCYPSRKTIAEDCCMTKNTVDKYMKSLEAKGLVKVVPRKRSNNSNSSNLYLVNDLTGA